MACPSCIQHRKDLRAAIQSGSPGKIIHETARAVSSLGENAGRKLVRLSKFHGKTSPKDINRVR